MSAAPEMTLPPGGAPRFLRRLMRQPVAVACVIYLTVIVVVAIVAPIVLPQVSGQQAGNLLAIRQGPSMQHLLGTDTLGRDVLARLLVGARVSMAGVAEALLVVLVLGVPFGVAAGYYGRWLDGVVGWFADLAFAMPAMIIILAVIAVFPGSTLAAMTTLGVLAAPGLVRVVRSAAIQVRGELYIAAARVSGVSQAKIIIRHVMPRIAGPIIVQASLLGAVALLVQTGLAFLNLLVAAPAPSWGGMVADGINAAQLDPWLIWPPGVAITLTVLAFGLLGDAARDATAEGWSAASVPRRRATSRPRAQQPRAQDAPAAGVSASGTLLSVEGLSVAFAADGRDRPVVQDVTFSVNPGEAVGLVGESGCGKTITAMSILGLLPGTAAIRDGQIRFASEDLAAMTEKELELVRGKQIGFISQEPMISLNPAFRVGWQLAEVIRQHRKVSRRLARAQAVELLERVRLPNPAAVARQYPNELSGGMAQRVAIARALAGEPQLLIADEPTTALDVSIQADILDLMRELQRDRGMAILLVTHDWGVVADLCARAVVMYAGQVVERAAVAQMFHAPQHPYTQALLACNPVNARIGGALPALPGSVPSPGDWPAGCHFHPRCRYADAACQGQPIQLEHLGSQRETRCIHRAELAAGR